MSFFSDLKIEKKKKKKEKNDVEKNQEEKNPKALKLTSAELYFKQANDAKRISSSSWLEGDVESVENKKIHEHLFMVVQIATQIYKSYPSNYYTLEDLISVGNLGLLVAAQSFDEKKGTKFSTYSYVIIKHYISHFIRESYPINYSKGKKFDNECDTIKYVSIDSNEAQSDLVYDDSNENLEKMKELQTKEAKLWSHIKRLTFVEKLLVCSIHGSFGFKKIKAELLAKYLQLTVSAVYKRREKILKELLDKMEKSLN